jgi:hypothetical protein
MARKISAKRRFEEIWERGWEGDKNSEPQQSAPTDDEDSPKAAKVWAQILSKPMRMAFKKARLDIENDDHRVLVLSTLAFAVYGGRGPGQPKRWTKRKLRRFRKRISEIQAEYPNDKEEACCERLLRKEKNHRYNKVDNAKTLRRVLQTAKRLDQDAQLVAAAVNDKAAVSDLMKMSRKSPLTS